MTDVSFKIGCKTAGALLALVVLGPVACRGAEPFSAGGVGFGLGSGGDLGLGGSGGAGGFGTLPVNTSGSGGAGTGGSSNGSGGSGSGGSTDAGVDVAMVRDAAVERVRDVAAPRDIMPEGPTTLINCYLYMPYKLDGAYDAGARVFSLRDLRVYQCKPWPFSGWCSQGAYEPGGATGYWPDAWMPIGYCE